MPRKAIDTPSAYNQNDVICGRGGGSLRNLGNYLYRKLIQINKEAYNAAERSEKSKISKMIVSYIRNQDPPGRFLEKDGDSGEWNDMDDKRAIEKTSQAIRECIRKETAKAAKEGGNCADSSSNAWLDNKANLQYAQQVEKMDLSSGIASTANFRQHPPQQQQPLMVQQNVISGNMQHMPPLQDSGNNMGLDPSPVYPNHHQQHQKLNNHQQQQQQQQMSSHQVQAIQSQQNQVNLHLSAGHNNINGGGGGVTQQVVTPIAMQTTFSPSQQLQAQQQHGSMQSMGSEKFVGRFNTLNMNDNIGSGGLSHNATFQHSCSMPLPSNISTSQDGLHVVTSSGGSGLHHGGAPQAMMGGGMSRQHNMNPNNHNNVNHNHNAFDNFIKNMRPDGSLIEAPMHNGQRHSHHNMNQNNNNNANNNNGSFEIMEPDPIPFLPSHPSNVSVTNAAEAEADFRLRSQSAPALSLEASTLRRSNKSLRTAGMSYHNGVAGSRNAEQSNQQWPSDQKNATFSFNNARHAPATNKFSNFPAFSFLETIEDGGSAPQKLQQQQQFGNPFNLTGQQQQQQQDMSANLGPQLLMPNNSGGNNSNFGELGDNFSLRRKKRTSPPRDSLQGGGSNSSARGSLHQTTTT